MAISSSQLQEAKNLLNQSQRILIVPHANVDPDGISSALASYLMLTSLGKECTVICPDALPESLDFLPAFQNLEQSIDSTRDFIVSLRCRDGVEVDKLNYAKEQGKVNIIVTPKRGMFRADDVTFEEGPLPYDLILVVDSAELSLLGSFYEEHKEMFDQIPLLSIDHHVSNTKFGTVSIVDPTAASATEVLYELFLSEPMWEQKMTADIATLLLTGLITDTRSFQNPNTTPESLEVAAELLDRGARQQEIIQRVYKTKPLSTLKIWGRALNAMQVNPDERILWSTISRDDLQEMNCSSKETHGIIDELLTTIPDMDVYILFTELEEGGFKASVRSTEAIDVSAAAGKLFGGGGHARAAGFRVSDYQNFQQKVIECVQQMVEEMRAQRGQTAMPLRSETQIPSSTEKKTDTDENGSIDIVKEITKK